MNPIKLLYRQGDAFRATRRFCVNAWPGNLVILALTAVAIPANGSETDRLDTLTVPMQTSRSTVPTTAKQPVDISALQRAESVYKQAAYDEALSRFSVIAAMHDHPFAWLRIGNIWHRRGQIAMAIDAYTRASESSKRSGGSQGVLSRAQKNLAMLGLSLASDAIHVVSTVSADHHTTRVAANVQWRNEMRKRMASVGAALSPNTRIGQNGIEQNHTGEVRRVAQSTARRDDRLLDQHGKARDNGQGS